MTDSSASGIRRKCDQHRRRALSAQHDVAGRREMSCRLRADVVFAGWHVERCAPFGVRDHCPAAHDDRCARERTIVRYDFDKKREKRASRPVLRREGRRERTEAREPAARSGHEQLIANRAMPFDRRSVRLSPHRPSFGDVRERPRQTPHRLTCRGPGLPAQAPCAS